MDRTVNYEALLAMAQALTEGVPYEIANLSNLSALLWQELPDINWAVLYKMDEDGLTLYPLQGTPACFLIPLGRGVCGRAAQTDTAQLVPDVHAFPGHIACDSASRSELVIPLHKDGKVWGVLDIDSPSLGRFTPADQQGLTRLAELIGQLL